MTDAITAARDLLQGVPLKVRRTIYGLLGLAVIVDSGVGTVFPDLLPARLGDALVVAFGLVGSVLALANSTKPLPPPPPLNGGVAPAFPDDGVEPRFEGEFP